MEEKKLDLNSIIGFVLISGILLWMLYANTPSAEELKAKEEKELVEKQAKEAKTAKAATTATAVTPADSTQTAAAQAQLGSFGYSATLPSATDAVTEIKNEVLSLKISNKGGYIVDATVLGFEQFEKNSKKAVQIIKDQNASLDITLNTVDNRTLHTKDLFFEPKLTTEGKNQVLTLQLKAGPDQFLEYRYVLKPNEYMLDFAIRSQGLEKIVNTTKPLDLEWQLKTYRNEKSISYENRYTELVFEYEEGKDDYLNAAKDSEGDAVDVAPAVAGVGVPRAGAGCPIWRVHRRDRQVVGAEVAEQILGRAFEAEPFHDALRLPLEELI